MATEIYKIPILASIRSALYFTYANIGIIGKAAAAWIGIYAAFTLIFQLIGIGEFLDLTEKVAFAKEFTNDARIAGYESLKVLTAKLDAITDQLGIVIMLHDILDKIFSFVALCAVAVPVMRSYLHDAELPIMAFAKAETRTLIYAVIYTAVVSAFGYAMVQVFIGPNVGDTVAGIFYVLFILILLFSISRFLLVFPAIADDNFKFSPLHSWQVTKSQSWALFGGMLLVILSSFPISIFKVTIGKIALPISVIWPAQLFLSMIIMTFILSFLAICYQYAVLGKFQEKQGPLF